MTSATAPSRVEAQISGEISGQIAVGNHIIQNNVDHGGVVYIAAAGERPVPHPRPTPVYVRGRGGPALLGREKELARAMTALQSGAPVNFFAPPGAGKTSLLKHIAHHPPPGAPPDGVVYHEMGDEPLEDSLQFLFEAFYESDVPFKATEGQISHYLDETRALIALDDAQVGRDEICELMDAAPNSTFLFASRGRLLWGEGRSLSVHGLSGQACVELLERELGRDLVAAEESAARAVCGTVHGYPLRILQVAALAQELDYELSELAGQLGSDAEIDVLVEELLDSLDDDQRDLLAVLTTMGGDSLGVEHLAALTGVSDASPLLEELVRRGLAKTHSPRYSSSAPLPPELERRLDPGRWEQKALAYFAAWAESNRADTKSVAEEKGAIVASLRAGGRRGSQAQVLRLARGTESAFMLAGLWGAWESTLQYQRRAARVVGDRAAEAWSLHQLGSRALCLERGAVAEAYLREALGLRESLGDHAGAAVTRHNLGLLSAPPPAPPREAAPAPAPPPPPVEPSPRHRRLPLGFLLATGAALLLLLGGLAAWLWTTGAPPAEEGGDRTKGSRIVRPSAISARPLRLDFGRQRVGTVGTPRSIEVTGAESEGVTIDRIDVVGDSLDFEKARDDCTGRTLVAEESCRLAFSFAPTTPGGRSASVVVHHDASRNPLTVALVGTGTAGAGSQLVVVSPSQLDFGRQPVGSESRPQTAAVVNRSGRALQLGRLFIAGANPRDFRMANDGCSDATIGPSGSCTVQLSFAPRAQGGRSASVVIEHDASRNPLTVALIGTGTGGDQVVAVSRGRLDFGAHPVGSESRPRTAAVVNRSGRAVRLGRLVIAGRNPRDFKMANDGCNVATIAPSASCSLRLSFAPRSTGRRRARLVIPHDASRRPLTVALIGRGLPRIRVGASAYALDLKALQGEIAAARRPAVEASIPPGARDEAEASLHVALEPVAESSTARLDAAAARRPRIQAALQQTMQEATTLSLPSQWNARGYARTELLEALDGALSLQAIEGEAVARCTGRGVRFATAVRGLDVTIDQEPMLDVQPRPNQVFLDDAGNLIILWETNWDPVTGRTTDGSNEVFVNALHVIGLDGEELIVSHAEARGNCAG